MNREQAARKKHNSRYSCASAVYSAFNDVVSGASPIPRSEGGKCGAVLAAEKVLKQQGLDITGFEEAFIIQYGSLKCDALRHAGNACNDLVGTAARLASEVMEE